ncbi:MAG: hypothetical protein A3A80_01060 [Candidatus Terrybacteria bacterium RIFCSPLOWO2_01_FULL_44_24]|uniref:Phosphoglycerate mutase n=1 Tax=Candidatus Terrybacteria bacterium RIFCSPHIGHO2_01_FULL_43_35 TaxID=1802361 RepID=A0A1G2PEZ4_9BACT|nr:MAG: hypothetical protein A2828_04240 [Candidatus Terrybacteria bacterium RIFCSPHIGHO2_01_FULL_43_35]OHA49832.1 MAG: hypothetical protein A3B75_02770 [Candidatus Terrybacteria bacterium RIFCSPHIGHO2_02_FULL_43_14]OHA50653.1 MAG: hypothetical protein A3A80_01060 [Candidatus Terrybacteria bacterium RIFCSPLOWO2_01_FULL_44_24]
MRAHSFFGTVARDYAGMDVLTVVHGLWLILARKLIHHWNIDQTVAEFNDRPIENASVTVYRGIQKNGKSRLELDTLNLVPWQDQL